MGRLLAVLLALVSVAGVSPAAGAVEVDLELVLAVDVSFSVDESEQRLQRAGYIGAFRSPLVHKAIRGGLHGRIAVTYFEWAGDRAQRMVVPWTLIEDAESAEAFAAALAAAPGGHLRRTSISGALLYGAGLFEDNGYEGIQRKIDVSGDGPNNAGPPVAPTRDVVVARGVTINGLSIILDPIEVRGFFDIPNLDHYYEDCVIGGPGAFNLVVRHEGEFAEAILSKLLLEIAGPPARPIPAGLAAVEGRSNCLIGEIMWREYMENN